MNTGLSSIAVTACIAIPATFLTLCQATNANKIKTTNFATNSLKNSMQNNTNFSLLFHTAVVSSLAKDTTKKINENSNVEEDWNLVVKTTEKIWLSVKNNVENIWSEITNSVSANFESLKHNLTEIFWALIPTKWDEKEATTIWIARENIGNALFNQTEQTVKSIALTLKKDSVQDTQLVNYYTTALTKNTSYLKNYENLENDTWTWSWFTDQVEVQYYKLKVKWASAMLKHYQNMVNTDLTWYKTLYGGQSFWQRILHPINSITIYTRLEAMQTLFDAYCKLQTSSWTIAKTLLTDFKDVISKIWTGIVQEF